MATSTESACRPRPVPNTEKTDEMGIHDSNDDRRHESRQLLYTEKFEDCYKEDKLHIVGNKKFPSERLKTHRMPECSVLSQIKAFLPEMSKANASMVEELKSRPDFADSINIECIDDSDNNEHVQMNLSVVPSSLLSDSDSDESSSCESSSEENDESVENDSSRCQCSSPSSSSSPDRPTWFNSPEHLIKSTEEKLKLPRSSKKSKTGKSLIEEIVTEEDDVSEDFANR